MKTIREEISCYFDKFLQIHPELVEENALTKEEVVQDICDIVSNYLYKQLN